MTDTQENKMDYFYQRHQKETLSHTFARSRLLVIFSTMIFTLSVYPVLRMLGAQIHVFVSGGYMSGQHSVLLINCPTEQAAKDIGRHIMEKRMAACVNVLPRTSTIAMHPYEIPEIISFPIEDGSMSYFKWMDDAVPEV
ncbi:protein CutA homolog isoform X2 [Electrophorus electricus]|uniref:protein CutA homolog isoform X2 n=1 Tax=Electrophorus electricus TaxID=8005 RepID=UPI0015D098CC|nr:protein CutA homolog isoform X2 [Electrophorus electricus]